jgi:hypothetical protein
MSAPTPYRIEVGWPMPWRPLVVVSADGHGGPSDAGLVRLIYPVLRATLGPVRHG